jgi:hypothetical protein
MSSFILKPLPAGEVDAGAPVARCSLADDRSPCRRCLRDAEPGEPLVLAPYDPFTVRSPYAGEGPVFVHAEGCEPFRPVAGAVSEQVPGRVLSLRAYDGGAMMTDAEVVDGERFAERAAALLGDERVAFLHAHFAGPGCFAFRVDRA